MNKSYGQLYKINIDDKEVVAICTTFLGFSHQLGKDKYTIEIKPNFMYNPTNELSDWLTFMFNQDILSIDPYADTIELRHYDGHYSECVEVSDILGYYIDEGSPKTFCLTQEEFDKYVVKTIDKLTL